MRQATRHDRFPLTAFRSELRLEDRSAFTLIEIIVVIGLIALLFSLVGVAVMSAIGSAKIAATKATIVKVQGLLQQRLDSVMLKDPEKRLVDSLAVPGRFPNRKQAEAIARKITARQAFPQTWTEIQTFYPNLLARSNETAPAASSVPRPQESAEVLYFLLTRADVLGYPPEGVDVFSSAEVKDTDSPPNGKLEIVDAWGRPLRFYRWPTRLVRGGPFAPGGFTASAMARGLIPSLPTTATDLTHDADDKFGFLRVGTNTGLTAVEANFFEQGGAPSSGAGSRLFGFGAFHTPETFSLPLVVSGGPDLATGLFEPGDITNFGFLAAPDPSDPTATFDDITNYSIRSGGN